MSAQLLVQVSLITSRDGEFEILDYQDKARLQMDPLGMNFGRGLPDGSRVTELHLFSYCVLF